MTKPSATTRSIPFFLPILALTGLLLWCASAQAERISIPLFAVPVEPGAPQGVLRIVNAGGEAGTVEVRAIDDAGMSSTPVTFALDAFAAVELTAADLAAGNAGVAPGNAGRGAGNSRPATGNAALPAGFDRPAVDLSRGIDSLAGDMRLEIETDLDIHALAWALSADGTPAPMHDTLRAETLDAPDGSAFAWRYEAPVFNPASDLAHASRLRLANPGSSAAAVTISARDDAGAAAPGGEVRLTLPPGGSRTLAATEIEAGGADLEGRLGEGVGKWRLTIVSDRPIEAMNLVAGPAGALNNLSTAAETDAARHAIPLFVAPGAPGAPEGVLRVLNLADEAGTATIHAIDDSGHRSAPASLALGALAAAEFTAGELAFGHPAKGLSGGIGPLAGDVRLEIESALPIAPLAYARAADGALSAMHGTVAPTAFGDAEVESAGIAFGGPNGPTGGVAAAGSYAAGGAAGDAAGDASVGNTTKNESRAHAAYRYEVPVFNPAGDIPRSSRLRLANPGDTVASVTITARDDSGATGPGGSVRLTLPPGGARTLTAFELETGGAGLVGRLGAGTGRWRLSVASDRALQLVNLVVTANGNLVNLSTTAGSAGFNLAGGNTEPAGMVFVDGRFYVVDANDGAVYAYDAGGRRDAAADFTLAAGNGAPSGIAWVDGRFYVLDSADAKVYAYGADGSRHAAADFDIQGLNPTGITHADERFFVVDATAGTVHAYHADGRRDAAADFALDPANGGAEGIVHADGRFYVIEPADRKAYAYGAEGQRDAAADIALRGDGIGYFALPRGAAVAEGQLWVVDAGALTVSGYALSAGPLNFLDGSGPGDRTYTVDTVIATLTLPEATGGAAPLTYALAPDVPGLSFDPSTRRLSGMPTEVGMYAMTYTVTDAEGNTATSAFTVTVKERASRVPGIGFRLFLGNSEPRGVAWADGRFHVVDESDDKVYAYRADGTRDEVADFDLADGNSGAAGIAWADGRFHVVDESDDKVYAYRADGTRDEAADFSLDDDNRRPTGIAWANGRFHVVDSSYPDDKVYVYRADGTRDEAADFDLADDNSWPNGIAWADGRFHVVNDVGGNNKVYAYRADGTRDEAADFELFLNPMGIAYADGRFHVVNRGENAAVNAYRADGTFDRAATFGLYTGNSSPRGIAWADGRFHVVDSSADKVYAYRPDGTRDEAADFDLADGNFGAAGIAWADGRFHVVDWSAGKVYAYRADGTRDEVADFSLDDDNLRPTGIAWANGRFHVVDSSYPDDKVYVYRADGTRDEAADFLLDDDHSGPHDIAWADGRFHVLDDDRKAYAYRADGTRDEAADLFPIDAYQGSISWVDGLLYAVDGEYLGVKVYRPDGTRVRPDGTRDEAADFDLADDNDAPEGIAWADGRFHVVDSSADKVYAYRPDGTRDEAADFDLADDNSAPHDIAWADGRFHVVNWSDHKVYAYRADGTRDEAADFDLADDNDVPAGIAWAGGRVHVGDRSDHKVYAYRPDGTRDEAADFDLADDNDVPVGIAWADGRFHVVDLADYKVYAYRAAGTRDEAADFDLVLGNVASGGIAWADGRLLVLGQRKVYAYTVDDRSGAGAAAVDAPESYRYRDIGQDGADDAAMAGSGTRVPTMAGYSAGTRAETVHATALSVEITRCSAGPSVRGAPGIHIQIAGAVRAGAPLSGVVVVGYGSGALAGVASLGRLAAGESRAFSIAETVAAPQGALSCSAVAEFFDIGALAPGVPVRADRAGRIL